MTRMGADLLIIGGGMVGASLACALAGLDLRVGLVGAAPFTAQRSPQLSAMTARSPWPKARGGFFKPWACRDALASTATRSSASTSPNGVALLAHLDCRDEGVDALGYVAEARLIGAGLLGETADSARTGTAVSRAAGADHHRTGRRSRHHPFRRGAPRRTARSAGCRRR